MADVGSTLQSFVDAGSAAQQGNWDAAAAQVAPVVEQGISKAAKPAPGDDCAAAAAKGAVGGAATGAAAGAAIFPPFGALIGAGVGALAGGLAAGAEGGCFDAAVDWRAEVQSLYAEAPFVRVVDVNGSALRKQPIKGDVWTWRMSPSEQNLDRFPLGRAGLSIGRYFWLLRRHRELGGGSGELARIVGLAAPAPAAATTTKAEVELVASEAFKGATKTAALLGANDAGRRLRNQLKNMRIAALMRGGFDRAEAERRVLGQPYASTVAGLTYLRGIIADAEPQASYVGPMRNIFTRPKPALPASTRANDVNAGESSAAVPLALGAAAVGAYFLLAR
jgi:hypothetical protein